MKNKNELDTLKLVIQDFENQFNNSHYIRGKNVKAETFLYEELTKFFLLLSFSDGNISFEEFEAYYYVLEKDANYINTVKIMSMETYEAYEIYRQEIPFFFKLLLALDNKYIQNYGRQNPDSLLSEQYLDLLQYFAIAILLSDGVTDEEAYIYSSYINMLEIYLGDNLLQTAKPSRLA